MHTCPFPCIQALAASCYASVYPYSAPQTPPSDQRKPTPHLHMPIILSQTYPRALTHTITFTATSTLTLHEYTLSYSIKYTLNITLFPPRAHTHLINTLAYTSYTHHTPVCPLTTHCAPSECPNPNPNPNTWSPSMQFLNRSCTQAPKRSRQAMNAVWCSRRMALCGPRV